jgi:hypothetical protein
MSESSRLQLPNRRYGYASGIVYVSILLLGAAGGFALTSSLEPTEAKSEPLFVSYSVYLIQSDAAGATFRNEDYGALLGIRPPSSPHPSWSIYGRMSQTGKWGAPANFTFQIPNKSGRKIFPTPLSLDLETTRSNHGTRTKFGFLKGSTRTEHWFDLQQGDLRVIELMSVNDAQPKHYYAVVQMLVVYPRPTSLSPFKRPRTMTFPSKGMSK